MKNREILMTVWEVWTYDVWGNRQEGYQVNDRFCVNRAMSLKLKVEVFNQGTPQEFKGASPSNWQLRKVFGVHCRIDTQGDDLTIYVERESDGYPIGELFCTSHNSLSPIRDKQRFAE